MKRDQQSELPTTTRGTAVATPDGVLLWVDDAFCAAASQRREQLVHAAAATSSGSTPRSWPGPTRVSGSSASPPTVKAPPSG